MFLEKNARVFFLGYFRNMGNKQSRSKIDMHLVKDIPLDHQDIAIPIAKIVIAAEAAAGAADNAAVVVDIARQAVTARWQRNRGDKYINKEQLSHWRKEAAGADSHKPNLKKQADYMKKQLEVEANAQQKCCWTMVIAMYALEALKDTVREMNKHHELKGGATLERAADKAYKTTKQALNNLYSRDYKSANTADDTFLNSAKEWNEVVMEINRIVTKYCNDNNLNDIVNSIQFDKRLIKLQYKVEAAALRATPSHGTKYNIDERERFAKLAGVSTEAARGDRTTKIAVGQEAAAKALWGSQCVEVIAYKMATHLKWKDFGGVVADNHTNFWKDIPHAESPEVIELAQEELKKHGGGARHLSSHNRMATRKNRSLKKEY